MKRYKVEISLWGGSPFEMEVEAENEKQAEKNAMVEFWDQADCMIDTTEMKEGEKLSWEE